MITRQILSMNVNIDNTQQNAAPDVDQLSGAAVDIFAEMCLD